MFKSRKHNLDDISRVNLLYLLSMLLVITLGSFMQLQSFSWGLLGTEVFCILVPAVLVMRREKKPVQEILRIYWPGVKTAIFCFLLGIAVWCFDAVLDQVSAMIFGYTPASSPGMFPANGGEALILFLALAVAAPICEEILFRGMIQRIYERSGVRLGIVFTAALFVFFHLRLQGFFSLIPVALLLGFMVWKTGSLISGMLIHFGNNFVAALVLIQVSLHPENPLPLPSLPAAAAGMIFIALGLFVFTKYRRNEIFPQIIQDPVGPKLRTFVIRFWPVAASLVIFAVMAGFEVVYGLFPERQANGQTLRLGTLSIDQPVNMIYAIQNKAGQKVGEMTCTLQNEKDTVALACIKDVKAFKIQLGSSQWQSGNVHEVRTYVWDRSTMNIVTYVTTMEGDGYSTETSVKAGNDVLNLEGKYTHSEPVATTFSKDSLLPDEWAWRLMAASFRTGEVRLAKYGYPSKYDPRTNTSSPFQDQIFVKVKNSLPVHVPAGNFVTWQIQVGDDFNAWYDANDIHLLVKLDDDYLVYELTSDGE
jgi:membrane protease YdiL (CAAX protease family)